MIEAKQFLPTKLTAARQKHMPVKGKRLSARNDHSVLHMHASKIVTDICQHTNYHDVRLSVVIWGIS